MTEQEVELERLANEEIIKLLEVSIITSGFFRTEKIPELIGVVSENGKNRTISRRHSIGYRRRPSMQSAWIQYPIEVFFGKTVRHTNLPSGVKLLILIRTIIKTPIAYENPHRRIINCSGFIFVQHCLCWNDRY